MILLDKVLTIGFNSCMRQATPETVILYSSTLSKNRVTQLLLKHPTSIRLDKTGAQIGEKFYKTYCINTILVYTDEKANIF